VAAERPVHVKVQAKIGVSTDKSVKIISLCNCFGAVTVYKTQGVRVRIIPSTKPESLEPDTHVCPWSF